MNNKIPLVALVLLASWSFFTSSNPSNPPTSSTGAPGEGTCANTGCHDGGTFDGTVTLEGLPDSVVANQTYNITLKNTSNAVRAGFQTTCLDTLKVRAGTFTAPNGSGVNLITVSATGRQYARQSAPKTLANGSTSWTFEWKAPATAAGNKVTFYMATLCANNANGRLGDNPLLGTKSAILKATSAVNNTPALQAKLYPSLVQDRVNIELSTQADAKVSIFNLQGRVAQRAVFNGKTSLDVSQLPAGSYVVEVTADNKRFTAKVVKQ